MADDRIARTIGIDELVQSITTATLRAIKQEAPMVDATKTGLYVHFRVLCGLPPAPERALLAAEAEE